MAMKNSKFLNRYFDWVLKRRWLVLSISIVFVFCASAGLKSLGFKNNYRIFFSSNNPQLKALDNINAEFNESRNVYIAVEALDGDIFTNNNLEAIKNLVNKAWSTPYSTRVDAITNYQHTYAKKDDLFIENLVPEDEILDDTLINQIKNIAYSEKNIKGRLVSNDGSMAGVNILLNTNPDSTHQDIEIVNYARQIAQELKDENPQLKTYITGQSALSISFGEAAGKDGETLIPLMFLMILLVTFLVTRSVSSTLFAFLIVLISILTGLGIAGWIGYNLNALSASAPTIILTLAIADSIHILVSFLNPKNS